MGLHYLVRLQYVVVCLFLKNECNFGFAATTFKAHTKKQTHTFQTSLQFWLIYKNLKSKQLQMA